MPARCGAERAGVLAALDTYAEPAAVFVAKSGMLVNVPAPARYAVHQLVTSRRRDPAVEVKGIKHVRRAEQLVEVLARDRPGDLRVAWRAAARQPPKFHQQLEAGLRALSPECRASLDALLPKKPRG